MADKVERTDFEIKGAIGIAYIENPGKLNALSLPVWQDLARIVDQVEKDTNISALILTSRGKHFSSGFDIEGIDDPVAIAERNRLCMYVLSKLEVLPVPVIAATRGFVFGGGFEMVLACDMVVASETSVFSLPEATLGATPPFGALRLGDVVGRSKAKEMLMLCSRVPAQEALALGIANKVVPDGELMDASIKMAEEIAKKGPKAIHLIKVLVNRNLGGTDMAFWRGTAVAATSQADLQEGVKAFFERRAPKFKGR